VRGQPACPPTWLAVGTGRGVAGVAGVYPAWGRGLAAEGWHLTDSGWMHGCGDRVSEDAYVPPHLRGGAAASAREGGTGTSAISNTSPVFGDPHFADLADLAADLADVGAACPSLELQLDSLDLKFRSKPADRSPKGGDPGPGPLGSTELRGRPSAAITKRNDSQRSNFDDLGKQRKEVQVGTQHHLPPPPSPSAPRVLCQPYLLPALQT
jgi:hypothetical protein